MSGEVDAPAFRILGPVEVVAEEPVRFARPQQRDLLGLLLLHANRAITVEQVVEGMWGGAPPRTANTQIHNMVSGIRAAITRDRKLASVERQGAGYVLHVGPGEVDAAVFADLVSRGRAESDPDRRAVLLRRGLRLWRGAPLSNVRAPYAVPAGLALAGDRGAALEVLYATELGRGRHAEVAGELAEWVREYPFRETLTCQWITALYRAGRRSEALAAYRDAVRALADRQGLEPSRAMRDLQLAMLRDDPALDAGAATAGTGQRAAAAPVRQLPNDVPGFAGRDAILAELDRLLDPPVGRQPTVVICAIDGTAGVGKTALAVHWAHRVRAAFPDGQLYVNLRGFDPSGPPTAPADALRGFLDAFGVPPDQVPAEGAARAARYRSLLADRRVLVVLDNARDAAQVRPLLPGSPGCLVVVTSRTRLTGLVAADGACPVPVGLMSIVEARRLLAGRLGVQRVAAEPEAVDDIVVRCSRLPLALALVAARAAMHPGLPLTAVADQLSAIDTVLDSFDGDDPVTDLRAAFSWSYDALTAPAARLFRRLGWPDGEEIGVAAAASLAGVPGDRVVPLLRELTRAHLVEEHRPGRFILHDLMRAYARERADAVEDESERSTAIGRLLDHYLHTAHAAARVLHPQRDPVLAGPPATGVTVVALPTPEQALEWFSAERAVLMAAIEQAGDHRRDTHVWMLAWSLSGFFQQEGRWVEWVRAQRAAVAAADRLADRAAQALAHRSLALAYAMMGRREDAGVHRRQALEAYVALGDAKGQAYVHLDLGRAHEDDGDHRAALRHTRDALRLFRLAHDCAGEARALNATGWVQAHLGDHEEAVACCRRALSLQQRQGDRPGQAATWDSLGYSYHRLGRHAEAVRCYQRAIDLLREGRDRYYEAESLDALGDVYRSAGDTGAARQAWELAVAVLDGLGDRHAEEVRTKLRALVPAG